MAIADALESMHDVVPAPNVIKSRVLRAHRLDVAHALPGVSCRIDAPNIGARLLRRLPVTVLYSRSLPPPAVDDDVEDRGRHAARCSRRRCHRICQRHFDWRCCRRRRVT